MKIISKKELKTSSPKLSYFVNRPAGSFILASIKIFVLLLISFMLIFYGASLQRNQTMSSIQQIIYNASQTKLNVVNNYINGIFSSADRINIDMDFEAVQLLNFVRSAAIKDGTISEELQNTSVKAKISLNDKTYKVKISPTGMNLDMIGSIDKRAYKVKMLEGEKIYGMSEFKLLPPSARHNMVEWVGHELEKKENLVAIRYFFIELTLNGNDLGVYAVEEHFNKELLENNRAREGIIFTIKNGNVKNKNNEVKIFNEKKYSKDVVKNNQITMLKSAIQSIEKDDFDIERFFDLKKYAKNYAIIELMGGFHAALGMNTFYYFNPVTTLVEPITREYNSLRYSDGPPSGDNFLINQFLADNKEYVFANKLFRNKKFIELYLSEMVKVSQKSYLDNFFSEIDEEFNNQQNIIFKDDPFYKFPKEYMYERQKQIIDWLNMDLDLKASIFNDESGNFEIKIKNDSLFPVELVRISSPSANQKELNNNVIYPGDEIVLYEDNIDSSNYKNFILNYKIHGIQNLEREVLIVPQNKDKGIVLPEIWNSSYDFLIENNNFIVNNENKTITFNTSQINIFEDIFIPEGFIVIGNPGLTINLMDAASIYSKSAFIFIGSESSPIIITSSDGSGGGIAIFGSKTQSDFKNTVFENLSSPNIGTSGLTASVSTYDTEVNFEYCIFQNNKSEDFLNLIQSNYELKNSYFKNINSDAVDSDFSNGAIKNTSFENIGNDALDFSGSLSNLDAININQVGDKALSAGEDSKVYGKNISIHNAEIGITSKDLSIVDIQNVNMSDTRLGFALFKKKEEFGPGVAIINKLEMQNIELDYLIDYSSSLFIDNVEIEEKQENVADSLYGSIYGKSSK